MTQRYKHVKVSKRWASKFTKKEGKKAVKQKIRPLLGQSNYPGLHFKRLGICGVPFKSCNHR